MVATTAGRLPQRAIIHVAGINAFWRATEASIRTSVRNAVLLAGERGFHSIAFPMLGAGTGGGRREDDVLKLMRDELAGLEFEGEVRLVLFSRD